MTPMREGGLNSEAAEIVRVVLDAFNRRDISAILPLIHPEARFRPMTAQLLRDGQAYVGRQGITQYFEDVERIWQSITIEPTEVQSAGEAAVVIGYAHVRGHAGEQRLPAVWTWKLRDGLVIDCTVHSDERAARKAIGLAE